MKILTQQKQVPWLWVLIIQMPWFANIVREQVSSAGIVFTLKKFTDDPLILGLVGSSNQAFGFLVGALCSFASDHIWTRAGRRRPFLLVGSFGSCLFCLLIPQMTVFWSAVAVIVTYQFIVDIGQPHQPLVMEVVPPHQRGRAGAVTQIYKAMAFGLALAGLVGGFDKVYSLPVLGTVTGEQVMYWGTAGITFCIGLLYLFLVKEVKPVGADIYPLHKVPLKNFFKELTSRKIFPLLGLSFVMFSLWSGIGQFESLLVTEQWGYSKEEYGNLMALSLIGTILLVPIGGWLSDRYDRMFLLKIGLFIVLAIKASYYVYAEYIAPGGIPPKEMVVLLGLLKGGIGSMMAVACVPLIFDFVTTNRLGVLSAAMGITFGVVAFLNVNLMGWWIKVASTRIYGLPDDTYNYMSAYHLIFLLTFLGIGYFYVFSHMMRIGYIVKLHHPEEKGGDMG